MENKYRCELEFISMDKQIYDKGKSDALDEVRAEIAGLAPDDPDDEYYEGEAYGIAMAIRVIDKHRQKVRNKGE